MHETQGSERRGEPAGARSGTRAILRWAPLVAVLALLVAGYLLGLQQYLSLGALRRYQETLAAFVAANPLLAPLAYLALYALAVAVSFPGASFLTIAGGFLFGAALGTTLAVVAATLGATAIFLIARTSLGDLLAGRAGPRVQRLRKGFREEGFSYLLFLRLVPLFPFWLVNLAAALFGMRVLPYVAATAIGIVPGTFVYSYFGHGLGSALEHEGPPASLFLAFALLGVMALIPVAVRKWRHGKETGGKEASKQTGGKKMGGKEMERESPS